MILPIYLYGQSILRKIAQPFDAEHYPDLQLLIDNMFETMHQADGVGLAAPQVGLNIRLIVIDASPLSEDFPEYKDKTLTLINPVITARSEETDIMEEGCLSLPGIHENVERAKWIHITYLDRSLKPHDEDIDGYLARMVQHEYDHIEGHLFTDRISPIRRTLLKGKLSKMAKGKTHCSYKTR